MSFPAFASVYRVIPDLFVQALSVSVSMHEHLMPSRCCGTKKNLECFGKCPADMFKFVPILMMSLQCTPDTDRASAQDFGKPLPVSAFGSVYGSKVLQLASS